MFIDRLDFIDSYVQDHDIYIYIYRPIYTGMNAPNVAQLGPITYAIAHTCLRENQWGSLYLAKVNQPWLYMGIHQVPQIVL